MVGLRASFSSGYRAPQAYEEDLHVAAVGGEVALIELDPNLKPEYSHSFSGSVDLDKTFGQVDIDLLIEGFYTDLRDVFALVEQGHDEGGQPAADAHERIGGHGSGTQRGTERGHRP